MARKVPDEAYVVMPNQLGIDKFDLEKALRDQEKYRCPCEEYADLEYMCSADLKEFIEQKSPGSFHGWCIESKRCVRKS